MRRFPEGVALAVAAVLGAVIVLAAVLVGRSLLSDSDASIDAAGEAVTTTTVSPAPTTDPDTGSDTQAGDGSQPEPAPRNDDAESDGGPGTSDEPAEQPESDVVPIECPDGVDTVICDTALFVQEVRERPFKTFPNVQILPDGEFDAAVLDGFAEIEADLAADEVVLSALGLIDPGVSYVDQYRDALEVGVVGFYDPDTGRLVLRGQELDLNVQNVLVHELTHALDDQWFDLSREVGDDEAEYGFSAVIEGNASRVDQRWIAELDPADRLLLQQQQLASISPADLQRFLSLPIIVQQLQLSPYQDGAVYVDELLASGGERAVDEALTTPPSSSEEVLHPLTDRRTDPEIDVEPPPAAAPGAVVTEGRLGELLIRLWLGRVAGDGWGGDHAVAWADDGRNCATVDIAADSDDDLVDIVTAAESWASMVPADRTVTSITDGSTDLVRITGCR